MALDVERVLDCSMDRIRCADDRCIFRSRRQTGRCEFSALPVASRQSRFGLRCGLGTQLVSHQHVGRDAAFSSSLRIGFAAAVLSRRRCTSRSRTSPSSSTARQSQNCRPAIVTAISSRCHVWMPPLAQDGFEWFGRVIGCGHVSGLQARPVTTAGRYGDARTRRKINAASF
jgi:hypothetical protein